MTKYTNDTGIPLALAVWLAHDEYVYVDDPKHISVTTLLKSPRQIILGNRSKASNGESSNIDDISTKIASKMGTAFHSSIELAWETNYKESLSSLGYPQKLVDSIVINPEYPEGLDGLIPVYLEVRTEKEVSGYTLSGAFDICINGQVQDYKSTSTYTFINKTNDEKYIQQASIYRWLNQDKITDDVFTINFIFTDWNAIGAKKDGYPPQKCMEYKLKLMPVPETERYITSKLALLDTLQDVPEADLPHCTDKELWLNGDTLWKYYKDPTKTSRSTKNFTNSYDANTRLAKDGSVGIVKEVKPKGRACNYCAAKNMCSQRTQLMNEGRI